MSDISENILKIKSIIPEHVALVAVSKTKPKQDLLEAYRTGQRIFGENKVQELVRKHEELPKDMEWHMIGHLQTNKVKQIVDFVSLIHGVDSFKLLKEINKRAQSSGRRVPVLLQIHIAAESSKFGLSEEELDEIITSEELTAMRGVDVQGLMGMATFTEDEKVIRAEFKGLKILFDKVKKQLQSPSFKILSMGMSGDYQIAIEEGSTMIRLGSSIFGERNYH